MLAQSVNFNLNFNNRFNSMVIDWHYALVRHHHCRHFFPTTQSLSLSLPLSLSIKRGMELELRRNLCQMTHSKKFCARIVYTLVNIYKHRKIGKFDFVTYREWASKSATEQENVVWKSYENLCAFIFFGVLLDAVMISVIRSSFFFVASLMASMVFCDQT